MHSLLWLVQTGPLRGSRGPRRLSTTMLMMVFTTAQCNVISLAVITWPVGVCTWVNQAGGLLQCLFQAKPRLRDSWQETGVKGSLGPLSCAEGRSTTPPLRLPLEMSTD